MTSKVFISYSHADERVLERLHKHLAMMQRDRLLSAWYDHAILPGANLDQTIKAELESADIFVALLSPDYLASNYCYENEFEFAQERARDGSLRIVPVVAEPCDWLSSPFREFMALPKEGKAISEWTNVNNAYLDIVNGLRRLIAAGGEVVPTAGSPIKESSGRKVRVKRDFDAIEKAEFVDKTFDVVRSYFRAASSELATASEDLRTRIEDMSPTAFTCTIVNRAKMPKAEAHITVHNQKSRYHGLGGDISYVFQPHAEPNTSNGHLRIEADEYNLFLSPDGFSGYGMYGEKAKYAPNQAAEWLWNNFVEQAGIQYE